MLCIKCSVTLVKTIKSLFLVHRGPRPYKRHIFSAKTNHHFCIIPYRGFNIVLTTGTLNELVSFQQPAQYDRCLCIQTVQTQIQLPLKKQSDQGLPSLLFWQAFCELKPSYSTFHLRREREECSTFNP